jgi:hypothetical protein
MVGGVHPRSSSPIPRRGVVVEAVPVVVAAVVVAAAAVAMAAGPVAALPLEGIRLLRAKAPAATVTVTVTVTVTLVAAMRCPTATSGFGGRGTVIERGRV